MAYASPSRPLPYTASTHTIYNRILWDCGSSLEQSSSKAAATNFIHASQLLSTSTSAIPNTPAGSITGSSSLGNAHFTTQAFSGESVYANVATSVNYALHEMLSSSNTTIFIAKVTPATSLSISQAQADESALTGPIAIDTTSSMSSPSAMASTKSLYTSVFWDCGRVLGSSGANSATGYIFTSQPDAQTSTVSNIEVLSEA